MYHYIRAPLHSIKNTTSNRSRRLKLSSLPEHTRVHQPFQHDDCHYPVIQQNLLLIIKRSYSENHRSNSDHSGSDYLTRLKVRLKNTKTNWTPIPIWIGASLLGLLAYLKKSQQQSEQKDSSNQSAPGAGVKIQGPWQVHVLGALPLRSISRLYGLLNSYTLPIWFRVPGYKLYSWIFGVNLEEAEIEDLKEYKSLNEFFMRKLKPDRRPIDPNSILTSPSDGKIINFGTIEGRRVGSVKGLSYSVDALLLGLNGTQADSKGSSESPKGSQRSSEESQVSSKQFANINDIPYSVDELMGTQQKNNQVELPDASIDSTTDRLTKVDTDLVRGEFESLPRSGNRMFFFVVYLAPGDYHRFHSPADWVVHRRRHFAGELFSVSPWMAGKLADLFVLNERVALLGRWKHGFFSMTPVGATNVGSININFDRELRTNRANRTTHHDEVIYRGPSDLDRPKLATSPPLEGGQALHKGDEVGAFSLGSTIVLVFEAPEQFQFSVKKGAAVKVGEAIGNA